VNAAETLRQFARNNPNSFLTMTHVELSADRKAIWLIAAAVAFAIAFGYLATLVPFNALILVVAVCLVPLAIWLIADVRRALMALLFVNAVLPRFASPVSIGFKPTFLDATLIGLLLAFVVGKFTNRAQSPSTTHHQPTSAICAPRFTPHFELSTFNVQLALLILVAVMTFIVGIPNGALTTLVIRRFSELVLSLLTIFVLLSILRDIDAQERFVTWAMLFGGLSASIGIALYILPDATAIRILSALRVFDYPAGDTVLRFIRDDPALTQRATGLWIDPNAFGGYLMMTCALSLPQLFTKQPALPRFVVFVCVASMALCLVLTVSRAAMLGLLLAAFVIGVAKYRWLLIIGAAIVALALVLPQTRELITHFAEGFAGTDLATQMRFGEYKDAFRLIERYPFLGVGFTGSPDVDLYVGVSSMYLLVAQQMGLLGLSAFGLVMIALFVGALSTKRSTNEKRINESKQPHNQLTPHTLIHTSTHTNDRRSAVFLGAHGAVLGALFSGIFDHYFFNIDFHNSVMVLCSILALAAASQNELKSWKV
jgi:hypothetical protein